LNACCRLKLDEVNRSKESEIAALRQHASTIEQQLANSNVVSFVLHNLDECAGCFYAH